jgi:hypothetical protein
VLRGLAYNPNRMAGSLKAKAREFHGFWAPLIRGPPGVLKQTMVSFFLFQPI